MSLLEIRKVERLIGPESALQYHIDTPVAGFESEDTAVNISGWAVEAHQSLRAINLLHGSRLLRTVPISVPRPDVVTVHPGAPGVSGFWSLTSIVNLDAEFQILIEGVRHDGSRVRLAAVHGRRADLPSNYAPRLQPLLVTSMGRTGTTWLMRLLSAHPAMVTYRVYPYEVRCAVYWLHVARVLGEPANHGQSTAWERFHNDIWTIGHNPFFSLPVTSQPDLMHWFARTYFEQLLGFCQWSIDDFYVKLAEVQGQRGATYFVEKFPANELPVIAWSAFSGTRELILVRDFRDVVASIFAFNEKRGTKGFGRDTFPEDEDYMVRLSRDANRLVRAWRSRSARAHLVRYEDLVTSPAKSLKAILGYLGLESSDAAVAAMVEEASKESTELKEHQTSSSPLDSIGRWRRDLPADLQALCNEKFRDALSSFGYTAS